MSFFRDILASTVASSLLAVPVTIIIGGVSVATHAVTNVAEDDEAILAGNAGIGVDRTIRVPVSDFPVAPTKGCRVALEGETFTVDNCWLRNRTYLLTLKKVAVR